MKYTILINQYAAINSGLELDLIDLAIFDFIKDFANSNKCVKIQTPEGVFFWISHQLIIDSMPILNIKSKNGVIKRIENLVEAKVLKKHPNCEVYNKTLYSFDANYEFLAFTTDAPLYESDHPYTKVEGTPIRKWRGPLYESGGDNIIIDNNNNNNNKKPDKKFVGSLFPEVEKDEKKKVNIFRNSEVYKLVKFGNDGINDYSAFEMLFNTPEFAPVDLVYYFHAVLDWSETKPGVKRTRHGWIATVRNFIRGDIEKNKVHLKQVKDDDGKWMQGAMEYLNGDY